MIYLKPKRTKLFDRWVYYNLNRYGNTIVLKDTLDQLGITIEEAKKDICMNVGLMDQNCIKFIESKSYEDSLKDVKEHYVIEVIQ